MTLEMAQTILEPFLLKKVGRLDITLMGGETLLSINVLRPLVEWMERGVWNRPYRVFGSTNGTLLDSETKQWLKEHSGSLTLGLSYDGVPSVQKCNRGNDNIDVDFFIETWPNQPIQMTINAESVNKMADGIIYLLKKGARVHPNVAFEKQEWPHDKIVEYGRQLNKLIYFYNSHENMPPITQFIHDLTMYADNIGKSVPQTQICGAGNGFQVFDTDGQSYPCHILSPLVLEGDKLKTIKDNALTDIIDFSNSNCTACPYSPSCPTCVACNYLYRDGFLNRDKTHCEIMKMEVRAFIKKEVLRLKAKKELTSVDASEVDAIIKIIEYEKKTNP